jgi:hypothetical protein
MTITEIKDRRSTIEEAIRREKERHQYKMNRFKILMKLLQSSCKHKSKKFYGDPTGSDSYYKCNACGAEL